MGNPLFLLCHLNRIERSGKFSSFSNVYFKIESIEENKRNWIQKNRNLFFEKDAHRTLSGAQAEHPINCPLSGIPWSRSAKIHRTVWFAPDMSSEPMLQRCDAPTVDCKSEQCAVRSQSSKVGTHRTVRCS
jgi:hypothetical protein